MTGSSPLLKPDDMLALIECGRELNAQLTLDVLLRNILNKAAQLTDSPDTSIMLRHDDRDSLYFAAATGEKAEWVLTTFGKHSAKDIPIYKTEADRRGDEGDPYGSKAGRVFATCQSMIENRVDGHFKGVDEESKKVTQSMVCVPLFVGDSRLGVMQILNKRSGDYDDYDRILLEHFAGQAAVAIQNARLFESLLAHSGLYTRLGTETDLYELIKTLYRPAHQENLTVLFADMRGFTQLCQSLSSPGGVQSRLNEFIEMLAEEVIVHDGMVNKFLGDGVMALFRDQDHANRAVKASFSMIER
ncbi:MAG: GAF domain-containing protein, partial [Planctomycetes bacterium]|nr:GAF domain-containing protein [Planctomycetota bacterium]